MATQPGDGGPLAIGPILKQARERRGVELAAIEQETKIRSRYLRALEDENWDALPGPAYIRGFIRAYAGALGLDAEVLVDEYRRRHEEPATASFELAEPPLSTQRREDRRHPGRGRLIAGVIVAQVLFLLLLLGITSGDGEDGERGQRGSERGERRERGEQGERGGGGAQRGSGQVRVRLVAQSDLQACVIDADDRVLVPDQLLTAGSEEGPFSSRRFRIELNPGTARLVVDGRRAARPSPEPVAYRLSPRGLREAGYSGTLCQ